MPHSIRALPRISCSRKARYDMFVFYKKEVREQSLAIGNSIFIGGIIALAVACAIGIMFGVYATRPLRRLTDEMKLLEALDFSENNADPKLLKRKDEIGHLFLIHSFVR